MSIDSPAVHQNLTYCYINTLLGVCSSEVFEPKFGIERETGKSRNPSSVGSKYSYLLSRKHFQSTVDSINVPNPPPPESGHVVPTSTLQTDLLCSKT